MASFTPRIFHFIGTNKVRKGTDWIREYQFVDAAGIPVDMSQYDNTLGGVVRMAIKSADLLTTYLTSAAGAIVLSWVDVYTLQIKITNASTIALTSAIDNSCVYQVEAVSLSSSLVDRILEGRIEMDFEVVTAST